MAQLGAVTRELAAVRGHGRKKERLVQLLSAGGLCGELARFAAPLPLPLRPDLRAVGLDAAASGVFNSAMAPLRLCFDLEAGSGAGAGGGSPGGGSPGGGGGTATLIFK